MPQPAQDSRQRLAPYLEALVSFAARRPRRAMVPGHKGGLAADGGLRAALGDGALALDLPTLIEGVDLVVVRLLGGRMAGEHLLTAGAERIAFLGDVRTPEIRQRFEGLAAALAQAGRPEPLLLETHLAADVMGSEIAAHLRRHGDAIDGVFAASDVIAMMTLRALADRGVPVPGAKAGSSASMSKVT